MSTTKYTCNAADAAILINTTFTNILALNTRYHWTYDTFSNINITKAKYMYISQYELQLTLHMW